MRRRILLVDNDTAVLLTLKAVLEMNQFEVDTASSAVEAVEKMRSRIYQMAITDARLETDDAGFHAIRAARQPAYNPATALLTPYPPPDGDWRPPGSHAALVE